MMLPQKAIAGAAGATLGGALVEVGLYLFGANPPPGVIVAMTTLVNALLAGLGAFIARFEGNA